MNTIICADCGVKVKRTGQCQKRCATCGPKATTSRINKQTRARRYIAKRKGLCMWSGCPKRVNGSCHCKKHAEENRKRIKAIHHKRKRLGACIACGKQPPIKNETRCGKCVWRVYTSTVRIAAKRGNIPVFASDTLLRSIAKQPCHYCGGFEERGFNGIDRRNSGKGYVKGYVKGNMLPCCWSHNKMKGIMSYDKFIAALRNAVKHLGFGD